MPAQTWPNPATITRPRRQTPVYQSHRFRGRHDTAHSGADRAFWAPAARVYSANSPGFNPHPPLRADAMCEACSRLSWKAKFQSSPALTGGCYALARQTHTGSRSFQSSPALTGGCYVEANPNVLVLNRVSILTRPYGRMLWYRLISFQPGTLFQSSPALTGGCYHTLHLRY